MMLRFITVVRNGIKGFHYSGEEWVSSLRPLNLYISLRNTSLSSAGLVAPVPHLIHRRQDGSGLVFVRGGVAVDCRRLPG